MPTPMSSTPDLFVPKLPLTSGPQLGSQDPGTAQESVYSQHKPLVSQHRLDEQVPSWQLWPSGIFSPLGFQGHICVWL